MNILIITDEYPPQIGGAGVVANQLYNDLCLDEKNNVEVYCSFKKDVFFKYKIFWLLYYFSFSLIRKILNSDIIIVNDIRSAYFLSLLSFFLPIDYVKKCTYIVHGTEYEMVFKSISFKNNLIMFPLLYKRFLRKCFKIIAVSKYTRDKFIYHAPLNLSDKIEYSYAGLRCGFFNHNIVMAKNKKEFNMVSVSRIEKRKGYEKMLDIFCKLNEKYPDLYIFWHIYGSGSYLNEFKNNVRKLNLDNKIIFKSEIDREKIFFKEFHKNNYDLFWLMPIEPEAFGLVFIEASSQGIPVLGVNRYGIKEAIKNNYSGRYYESLEQLESFIRDLKNEKIKEQYSLNGLRFSSNFRSEKFSSNIINNYRKI